MEFIRQMRGSKPANASSLLQQISKRAEDLTPDEQSKSFVVIDQIDGALKNRGSQIIFGRRGTGKTHILSYVAGVARGNGDVSCLIDLRTLGSNNSIYSDHTIEPSVRATRLIRDLLDAIYNKLLENYNDSQIKFKGRELHKALDNLSACVKTVNVSEFQEIRQKTSNTELASIKTNLSMNVRGVDSSLGAAGGGKLERGDQLETEMIVRGNPRLSINMGDASKSLRDISEKYNGRIWILLDEWSSLPELLQPYLADFIRRALLPVQKITVQIAAIEFRSSFRIDFDQQRVGFELGSDISASINLDDFFLYDTNRKDSIIFFQNLLFRHLLIFSGKAGLAEKSEVAVVNAVFSQDRVFAELVRASEGVPRDFINILQMAAMRSGKAKIAMNEIRAAAKDWFERDKQRNLDDNSRAKYLLNWIRDRVIEDKKARAFLLGADVKDSAIDFLFDERMLHIARRSYSSKNNPGIRYRVWQVDYGCYVDLINTAKAPTGFLFPEMEISDVGDIEVPEDDLRAVRRAILDLADFDRSLK
ncbi:hypothetical protein [uncultured Tistrella sp.]|uniref:ORC-CDC6 family AAA ATPase n=1 Tax=Tistrella mobilis TaxID=171437 RepID=UPI002638DE64|nr:hypothetical protein [uncultured Tistrella sp.]